MNPISAIDIHAGFRTRAWRRFELHPVAPPDCVVRTVCGSFPGSDTVAPNQWSTDRLRRRYLLLLSAEASPGSRSEFFQSICRAFATPHRRASALESGQQAAQRVRPRSAILWAPFSLAGDRLRPIERCTGRHNLK
jgi:hypothetical protein